MFVEGKILDEGRQLAGVVMADGSTFGFGDPGVSRIIVKMEAGQCSYVPWAYVETCGDACDEMLNLANAANVFLMPGIPREPRNRV